MMRSGALRGLRPRVPMRFSTDSSADTMDGFSEAERVMLSALYSGSKGAMGGSSRIDSSVNSSANDFHDWLDPQLEQTRREYGDSKLLAAAGVDSAFLRRDAVRGLKLRAVAGGGKVRGSKRFSIAAPSPGTEGALSSRTSSSGEELLTISASGIEEEGEELVDFLQDDGGGDGEEGVEAEEEVAANSAAAMTMRRGSNVSCIGAAALPPAAAVSYVDFDHVRSCVQGGGSPTRR